MGFFDSLFEHLYGKEEPPAVEVPPATPPAESQSVPTATPRSRKAKVQKKAKAPPTPKPRKGKTASAPESSGALDAGQFLPIARDDLAKGARKIQRWGPFFGRRDMI